MSRGQTDTKSARTACALRTTKRTREQEIAETKSAQTELEF
jgi:hypothetical protein